MTTLETKPIAFFFRPFSPLLGTGVVGAPVDGRGVGTAALSILYSSFLLPLLPNGSERSPPYAHMAKSHKWQMT
jgi:hypothetical protein